MKKTYKRLSLEERIIIETLLKENRSENYIGKKLNRNRSTITREVNLWVLKPNDIYKADLAHWYALETNKSKRTQDKINHSALKVQRFVLRGTESPSSFHSRMKLESSSPSFFR
ncbi:helix-turn-helix domain-containing protein [Flavobacterium sp. 7E]|uniref:helix-turn-helix domain-containing protein n=1 Tax=Flavobacterium sp. 7E TaxID=2735898 RepID=UPI00156EB375